MSGSNVDGEMKNVLTSVDQVTELLVVVKFDKIDLTLTFSLPQ